MVKYVDGFYTRAILRLADYDGTGYYVDFYQIPYHTIGFIGTADRWKWTEGTDEESLTGQRLITDLSILKW